MIVARTLVCGMFLSVGAFLMFGAADIKKEQNKRYRPKSEENEGGESDRKRRKKAWIELMHRAAPGVDWRAIERANALQVYQGRRIMSNAKTTASFANGNLDAVWYERGNNNQAGRITSFAYLRSTNVLYGVSDGGTIWKITPPSGSWSLVSDDIPFNSKVIATAPVTSSVNRILVANGEDVMYSDNDGSSFNTSTGITYGVQWGGNHVVSITTLNDVNSTVYCVTQGWDGNAWAPRLYLYRSTDKGATFNMIYTFNCDGTDQLSLYTPYNTAQLYALSVTGMPGPDTLFSVSGTTVAPMMTTNDLSADASVKLSGTVSGPTTHLYAITGHDKLYHSTDFGGNWDFQSSLPANMWDALGVSTLSPNFVSFGEVNAYRSNNDGQNWTLVNNWYDYYGQEATMLHADIQSINYFQYANGSEFCIIGTDGGAYISNDHLATVSNMSLNDLRINQLWDHISVPSNPAILFGGTQDQGLSYTNAASGTGLVDMEQLISGDYGQMRITGNENSLWIQYPGGDVSIYEDLMSPTYQGNWTMTGNDLPNYGWMLPTSDFFTSDTQNEILIGGGEINGGSGSYLIKLSADNFFNITPTQYSYDFRANSNSGTNGISAVAVSKINNNLMYVACEDGTFFYSTNAGSSWSKTLSFTGPEAYWLYGSSILPSKLTAGKVFFAGSGYSNPPVYMSTNNGQTFTDISNGLPQTLVNRLAANDDETLIFAATEAGPYVYVVAENMWYSLHDAGTPVQNYKTVEFLSAIQTVRFGTYGRGIWDLVIEPVSVPNVAQQARNNADVLFVPNPARSGGEVKLMSANNTQAAIMLLSLSGQVVWKGNVNTNSSFNIPVLPAGLYTCNIQSGGKTKSQFVTILE